MHASRSAVSSRSPEVRRPTIAWRAKPSWRGSVTATICMTPASSSRCTRCRTAASESPTARPIVAYGRLPSSWSCSMIPLATSSSSACWAPSRTMSRRPSGTDSAIPSSLVAPVSLAHFVAYRDRDNGIPCDRTNGVSVSVAMRTRVPPPPSPEAAALLRAMTAGPSGASRRTVLRGLLAAGAFAATGASLSACGTSGTKQTEADCVSDDKSGSEKKLVFSNWPLYIDVDEKDEKKRPTLDAFTTKSGIQVTYQEDINDNNEFFGKVRNQLSACQAIDRDIMVLTDWMASRMIRLGWVQKLEKDKIPNVEANLLPTLQGRSWDKANEYAVPWQSGLSGLAYNAKVTKEV